MSRRIRRNLNNWVEKQQFFLKFLDQIYYINLEYRKDRKESIVNEIKMIDPELKKTTRINAIKHEKGAVGCGKSHILALEDAEKNNYETIMILEDDFLFFVKIEILNEVYKELVDFDKDYNLFLVGKNLKRGKGVTKNLIEVYKAQTTSGYIIKNKFIPELKKNFIEAVEGLEKGKKINDYAIDIYWKKLQGEGKKIYTSKIKLGYQRSGYSDIEKRNVSYHV